MPVPLLFPNVSKSENAFVWYFAAIPKPLSV
jgi:hypothetical protein